MAAINYKAVDALARQHGVKVLAALFPHGMPDGFEVNMRDGSWRFGRFQWSHGFTGLWCRVRGETRKAAALAIAALLPPPQAHPLLLASSAEPKAVNSIFRPARRQDAVVWLRSNVSATPVSSADGIARAKAAGFSRATLYRALDAAHVTTTSGGQRKPRIWQLA
jgi:hypothetical protein